MFGSGNASDKLSVALEAYQRDYARRIETPENMDAPKEQRLLSERQKKHCRP